MKRAIEFDISSHGDKMQRLYELRLSVLGFMFYTPIASADIVEDLRMAIEVTDPTALNMIPEPETVSPKTISGVLDFDPSVSRKGLELFKKVLDAIVTGNREPFIELAERRRAEVIERAEKQYIDELLKIAEFFEDR